MEIFLDFKDRLSKDASVLSGGEKQELTLIRALMSEPIVLLLDEPSLDLSTKNVIRAFALIEDVNKKKSNELICLPQIVCL